MRAVFFKELRENAHWAALMALVLVWRLGSTLQQTDSYGESIVGASFLATTAFLFAGCGLTMGLLQVLQDARRGRWEFVIHRPTSRSRIFLGKVAAGLLLYNAAAGFAFAASVVWSATPGHVAGPFEWHMILPGLADLFAGWVWYAAGLLVGMRPARWMGSRLAPVGAAFICSAVATSWAITLTQALLVIAAGVLIVLPAAWASFVAAGQYERQPLIARGLQTVCVGMGIGLALAIAMGIASETLRMVVRYEPPNIGVKYLMDQGDKIYRITYSTTGSIELADLMGNVLPSAEAKEVMARQLEASFFGLGQESEAKLPWGTRLRLRGYRRPEAYIRKLAMQNYSAGAPRINVRVTDRPFNLFYVVNRGTIEGYDLQFRRRTLGIAPDGVTTGPELPQPFPQPLRKFATLESQQWMLAGDTEAWTLDLRDEPKIARTLVSPADDPIFDIGGFPAVPDNSYRQVYPTIVTRSAIHIFTPDRGALRLPLEHQHPQCQMVQVGRTIDRRYITWYTQPGGDSRTSWIVEADETGNIIRRTELPPHPSPEPKRAWWFESLEVATTPPVMLVMPRIWGGQSWLAIAILGISALACAAAASAICKRSSFGWQAALTWTILGLLFSWTALLALLCVRAVPARVVCPKCGQRRVVTRALCEHCGSEFEPPEPQGIEIFEANNPDEVKNASMFLGVG